MDFWIGLWTVGLQQKNCNLLCFVVIAIVVFLGGGGVFVCFFFVFFLCLRFFYKTGFQFLRIFMEYVFLSFDRGLGGENIVTPI